MMTDTLQTMMGIPAGDEEYLRRVVAILHKVLLSLRAEQIIGKRLADQILLWRTLHTTKVMCRYGFSKTRPMTGFIVLL